MRRPGAALDGRRTQYDTDRRIHGEGPSQSGLVSIPFAIASLRHAGNVSPQARRRPSPRTNSSFHAFVSLQPRRCTMKDRSKLIVAGSVMIAAVAGYLMISGRGGVSAGEPARKGD